MTHAVPIERPSAERAAERPRDPREPERVEPDPPRYWWLKRLTAGCVMLAAGLLVLRLAWGWEAERRFRRAMEPVLA